MESARDRGFDFEWSLGYDLSLRWISRLLIIDHKGIFQGVFGVFNRNPDGFLYRFITWINHKSPKTKQQSKHCDYLGESVPKKVKMFVSQQSRGEKLDAIITSLTFKMKDQSMATMMPTNWIGSTTI